MMSQPEQPEQENLDTPENAVEAELSALRASLQIKEVTIEGLKKKISEYETKVSEIREFVKRMESETAAVRERAKRDIDKNVQAKSVDFVRSFLQLVDHFERSLDTVKDETTPFVEGVRLMKRDLDEILRQSGVKRISTTGEKFDPTLHEAVASEKVDESQDGFVTRELSSGFQMGDQVIRVARVMVGSSS